MTSDPPREAPARRLRLVTLLGLAAMLHAAGGRAAAAVVLPDTGLFTPVAAELRARLARLAALPGAPVTAERLRLLLDTGRPDEAARLASHLTGDTPEDLVARARVALTVQDFAAAAPLVERLATLPDADARATRYLWEYARDAAGTIDTLTRARLAHGDTGAVPELLAAGRVAYDLLDYGRADTLFARALAATPPADSPRARAARSAAHVGRALVMQKRRQWDASLVELRLALEERVTPEALETLANTLIRLGRTDEAISAAEWGVRLNPYHDPSHYLLGNGYARKNYTQLVAVYPRAFADVAGRHALADADAQLAAGRRDAARTAYARVVTAHPGWVDARIRLASLDFEDGRFAPCRDGCVAALAACPEYGRAHAVLAKALESQRFAVDVHRLAYERQFAHTPMPDVPGIERFVVNWRSLSPRHQKRVALSVAPWKAFVPVLVDGGATFYIKPVYMLLSDCPGQETLHDQRIDYDSRLWDDVRGCGGYHTVTGIEDVERTIFDRYNTVTHELTHQVHAILTADDKRVIQELYRRAKVRDDSTHDGFLSRYAGGSVFEYFAEGANALVSPKRDAYDPREVVRERLEVMDPGLEAQEKTFLTRQDVSASYPVAYAAGGDDRVERGQVSEALPLYRKALATGPDEETAMVAYANALVLGGQAATAESVATRAVAVHPASGPARLALADARWHAGRGLDVARRELAAARGAVRAEDRYRVDEGLGDYAWVAGDTTGALAAFDSVLAYQSDNPEGLRGRASALALAGRDAEAFRLYDDAVRGRTGVVDLRCDLARDLLWAGRTSDAVRQLDEARLLDAENPTAEALRGWAALAAGDVTAARAHVKQALAWGSWCDLARIVEGGIAMKAGDHAAAEQAWAPVRKRIEQNTPPSYVYRPRIAVWEHVHTLPAVERRLLDRLAAR
ncbi:MAG: tetratricopeptide repeat protein [Candidatus Eisenbacteria bacterium]